MGYDLVKGLSGHGLSCDVACVADPSPSHPVSARGGCTTIPLAPVWAQDTRPFSRAALTEPRWSRGSSP